MSQATGRMRTAESPAAAHASRRWCSMAIGQKSWTMMRTPFRAWKRTAKKIASSATRKSGER
jgi:hypothetical protein